MSERELIAYMGIRLYRAAMSAPIATTKTARLDIVRGCKGRARRLTVADAAEAIAAAQTLRSNRRARKRKFRATRGTLGDKLAVPLAQRWDKYLKTLMYERLRAALAYHPANGGLAIKLHDNTEISATTATEDLGKYSNRCTYHKIAHHGRIDLPRHGVKVSTADGVTMILRYRQTQTHGGVSATPGAIISRRGYQLEAHEAWLAYDGEVYAHGATRHAAMRSLAAKRTALRRKAAPITLDTIITPAMYQRITGACTEGTNDWLASHGLDRKARGTVRELLAMLADGDFGKARLSALANA